MALKCLNIVYSHIICVAPSLLGKSLLLLLLLLLLLVCPHFPASVFKLVKVAAFLYPVLLLLLPVAVAVHDAGLVVYFVKASRRWHFPGSIHYSHFPFFLQLSFLSVLFSLYLCFSFLRFLQSPSFPTTHLAEREKDREREAENGKDEKTKDFFLRGNATGSAYTLVCGKLTRRRTGDEKKAIPLSLLFRWAFPKTTRSPRVCTPQTWLIRLKRMSGGQQHKYTRAPTCHHGKRDTAPRKQNCVSCSKTFGFDISFSFYAIFSRLAGIAFHNGKLNGNRNI